MRGTRERAGPPRVVSGDKSGWNGNGNSASSTYYAVALCKYRKAITILQLTRSGFIVSSLEGGGG